MYKANNNDGYHIIVLNDNMAHHPSKYFLSFDYSLIIKLFQMKSSYRFSSSLFLMSLP